MALAPNQLLDHLDGLGGDLGGLGDTLGFTVAADFKNVSFGFVQDGLDFVGSFVGSDHDLGAGLLEFAKQALVLDLFDMGGSGKNADDPGLS